MSRLALRWPQELFDCGQNDPALRVAENHDERSVEPLRGEFDAADLRRSHDVPGNPDDEEVAQALVEDDFRWDPRVRTSENDGERLLPCSQLVAARPVSECVAGPNPRDKATVPIAQAFECFLCRDHRCFPLSASAR
jgi:hypothetical protein